MTNLIKVKSILILSVITFVLSGCDGNRILDENKTLANSEWSKNDTQIFSFEIIDTTLSYNVLINVRNTSEYTYRNLYLFIEMSSPSNKYFVDTVEISLADKNGRWKGSGTGNIWQNQIPLLKNVKLLESGTYKIKIIQGMRHDTLKAISDIGVRVEKAL